jgi:hypothetical protein
MADISALVERLKNNKLAIPALVVGGVVGVYVLAKSQSGGSSNFLTEGQLGAIPVEPTTNSGGGGAGSGGGGNDAAIGEIVAQQQGFQAQVQSMFENLASGVQSLIGQQAQQTQDAINAVVGQQQSAFDALAAQQASGAFAQQYIPDFSQIYGALQSIPQFVQQAPQLQLGQQNLSQSLQSLARNPITYASGQAIIGAKPITTRSPNSQGLGLSGAKITSLGSASGYAPPGSGRYTAPPPAQLKPAPKAAPVIRSGGGTVARK